MRLKVIGTGSKGNAYLLYNEQEALLIECGVNFKEIKIALDFDLTKLVGCILTHEHGDHAKSVKDLMDSGIKVYATGGTLKALKLSPGWTRQAGILDTSDLFSVGSFRIMSFDVKHDAADPSGFLIHHPECGNVLFLTDTYYCPYTFRNLNNVIIEANYEMKIVKEKLNEMQFLKNRIMQSHMSLETCIDMLKANDLSQVNNILLIHLSDSNSHEVNFKNAVQNATGRNVLVASNGMDIPFNKEAF